MAKKECSSCGKKVRLTSRTGLCFTCYMTLFSRWSKVEPAKEN